MTEKVILNSTSKIRNVRSVQQLHRGASHHKTRAVLLAGAIATALAAMSGCGGGSTPESLSVPELNFVGTVTAGGASVQGATVQLYAASTTGYSTASLSLTNPVSTDANGHFAVNLGYTCPSAATPVYLVARGTGNHAAMVLLTALGRCDSIKSTDVFEVNEVTTVAFVWAVAPFMTSATAVGTSATNTLGLTNAFLTAQLLADVTTGKTPSPNLASTVTVESAKISSLANALSPCASAAVCNDLFIAAFSAGISITDTVSAAVSIVKHPSSNVAAVYQAGASGPFQGLGAPPSDWTMSLASTGGGLQGPLSVSVDSTGRAWVGNYFGVVDAYKIDGSAVFATPLTSPSMQASYGIAVDPSDNVWVVSRSTNAILEFSKTGVLLSGTAGFTGGGISYPMSVAADANGNLWVASLGSSSVQRLSSTGVPMQSTGIKAGDTLGFALGIALDSGGTPWVTGESGEATHLTTTGALIRTTLCCAVPNGIAVDPNGDAWVVDELGDTVVHVSAPTGSITSVATGGGLDSPSQAAIDGAGIVWVTNNDSGTLTEISPTGSALSPPPGIGSDPDMQGPRGIAIDASGSIWVTSSYDSRLLRFVGLAAPVKTPLLGNPQLP